MHDEIFYSIKPDLTNGHLELLSNFLSDLGYGLSYTTGDLIHLCCGIKDVKNGEQPLSLSANLTFAAEDILSKSIPIYDAADKLRSALQKMNPKSSLTLIDGYIFPKKYNDDYIDLFCKIFVPILKSVKVVNFVTSPGWNKALESELKDQLRSNDVTADFCVHSSDDFHDRYWIVDGLSGIALGTSLNGVCRQHSGFYYLSSDDVCDVVDCLRKDSFQGIF